MARRPNYGADKRQKEIRRQQKRDRKAEKRQQKRDPSAAPGPPERDPGKPAAEGAGTGAAAESTP